jgi:voltage-gated potassium channel
MAISPRKFARNFFGYLVSARYLILVLGMIFLVLWLLLWWSEAHVGHGASSGGYGPWESLYLAAITSLTIGYGDLAPVTIAGRIIVIALGIEGLVFVGIVVAAAVAALPESEE